jgi:succinate-semialdehyde dehydrogenase/glutarate-semialdehyde dehydrogenase
VSRQARELVAIDPATGAEVRRYAGHGPDAVEAMLAAAASAVARARRGGLEGRTQRLKDLARVLRRDREPLAQIATVEMGKPIREAVAEVEKCALACEVIAERGPGWLAPEVVVVERGHAEIVPVPRGVILAIMPWNFPYWQVVRNLAPALLAGNAVLLKHASSVPGCALALEERVREVGFDDGGFAALLVGADAVPALIADPRVRMVCLTGSTEAGRSVAELCGRHLKPSVLELGGSDPYFVLADADLELAADVCATARMVNGGQSCIAGKRFIVEAAVAERFVEALIERLRGWRMGSPLDSYTTLGPMARRDLRDQLAEQVRASVAAGAICRLGGEVPGGPGAFYPATVLTAVAPGMPAWDEELFGPVAAVRVVSDEAEAIAAANDTCWGLGAGVITADLVRGRRLAIEELEAGSCFVNAAVRSDPRLPFGGTKDSGWGRELGRAGILELCELKTVWIGA